MSTIIPKDQMTEEDVKLNFITPALVSRGWQNKITMETKVQFTDGKVNIKGNIVSREPAKKADYIQQDFAPLEKTIHKINFATMKIQIGKQ